MEDVIVSTRLDVDLIDEIEELAQINGLSRAGYIRAAILQAMHEGLNPLYAEDVQYVGKPPVGVDSDIWSRQQELWEIYYATKWGDGE